MTSLVDTSALAKLIVEEGGSAALRAALAVAARDTELVISALAVAELRRLVIRLDLHTTLVDEVIPSFSTVRLTEGVLQLAGRLPSRNLGTLDAIHLATAITVEADTLITYDTRQAEAARREGLIVVSPE